MSQCKWACSGCYIDKKKTFTLEQTFVSRLVAFAESLKSQGAILKHLELGPVDFMVSKDFINVMTNPKVLELCTHFEQIFLTASFLSKEDVLRALMLLNQVESELEITLFVPVEINKVSHSGYLTNIQENMMLFQKGLSGNVKLRKFYTNAMGVDFNSGDDHYLEIIRSTFDNHGLLLSLNNTCGRNSYVFKEGIESNLYKIKRYFQLDNKIKAAGLSFDQEENQDYKVKRGLLFSQNKVFHMPYLNQFFANNLDEFEINKEIIDNLEEYIDFEGRLALGQLARIHEKKFCLDCPQSESCIDRGVLTITDLLNQNDCILGIKY